MAEIKGAVSGPGSIGEGVIVSDDSAKGKRPVHFMQPDWKGYCADTLGQAPPPQAPTMSCDGRHVRQRHGDQPRRRRSWGRHARRAQDLAFTSCGARPTRVDGRANKRGLTMLEKRRRRSLCEGGGLIYRAGARRRGFPRGRCCSTSPIQSGRSRPALNIKGRCWRSRARRSR